MASVVATGATLFLSTLSASAPAAESTPTSAPSFAEKETCTQLTGRTFAGGKIESAETVPEGGGNGPLKILSPPAMCRVHARISSRPDSNINVDVWLPAEWNGKLLGIGGAGWNGSLITEWALLAGPAKKGYAGVATDAGHDVSERPLWALGHPEKIADFGYRSNHLAAAVAKAIIAAYYRAALKRSYFHGCSNGGRDALILAERYPDDYDGIIVGAPANNWTGLFAAFMHDRDTLSAFGSKDEITAKLKLVHEAVIRQCDAQDGARDGLISNPQQCRFDPAVLQCKSEAGSNCLTAQEVTAVKAIYAGTRLRNGKLIMPGFARGSEYSWADWMPADKTTAPDFYRYLVYGDPKWDPSHWDLDRDYRASKRKVGADLDATNPDIRPFIRRGGKLLMYHGWEDAAIPPANTVGFYAAIRRVFGASADHVRLFMVPGMAHCWGGNGPNVFDQVGALDAWVEHGRAPERLVATKYDNFTAALAGIRAQTLQTRPICAWPKSPRYKGSGSVDNASSFVCS